MKNLLYSGNCWEIKLDNYYDPTNASLASLFNIVVSDLIHLYNRSGVEDTRLEAKDTKKSEAKAKGSPSEDRPSRRC